MAEVEATEVSARLASASFGAHDTPILPEAYAAAAVLNLTASTEEEATWLPFGQFIAEQVAMHVVLAERAALSEAVAEHLPCGEDESSRALSKLLRDIIGNPFGLVTFEKAWLTPEVVLLARAIYDGKAFERMGVLADTLQEVGCANADILGHCPGAGAARSRVLALGSRTRKGVINAIR